MIYVIPDEFNDITYDICVPRKFEDIYYDLCLPCHAVLNTMLLPVALEEKRGVG